MAMKESKEVRLEDEEPEEEERILTLKIDLTGPVELLAWMRENSPFRVGERLTGMLPGDFRRHMRAAQREQLLALRSLLDSTIERLEKAEERKPAKRATKVEVE